MIKLIKYFFAIYDYKYIFYLIKHAIFFIIKNIIDNIKIFIICDCTKEKNIY